MWVPTTIDSIATPKYKMEAHGPWKVMKGVGKQYCDKCGLMNLNNPFTKWAIQKGCDHDLHVSYKQMRKLTRGENQ